MLTYAETQRRFPHKCAGLKCAVCRYEDGKYNRLMARLRLSSSAVRRARREVRSS